MHARRSEADWAKIVSEFTAAGGSPAAFCARRRIKLSTFTWWRWRLREGVKPAASPPLVELVPVAVVDAAPVAATVVVAVADVEVRIATGVDVRYVAALVEALRRC